MSMKAALQSPTNPTFRRRDRNATLRPAAKMSTRIHRLIEEQGVVLMPGCYDALSAAIVQKSGFSAGFISGYALSASLLGKPDFGLLTYASSHSSPPSSLSLFCCILISLSVFFFSFFRPPEMAETARFVCAAAPLMPIIADAGIVVSLLFFSTVWHFLKHVIYLQPSAVGTLYASFESGVFIKICFLRNKRVWGCNHVKESGPLELDAWKPSVLRA